MRLKEVRAYPPGGASSTSRVKDDKRNCSHYRESHRAGSLQLTGAPLVIWDGQMREQRRNGEDRYTRERARNRRPS